MEAQEIIQKFYTAFQNKDYKVMQECYADDAVFSDAVFQNLDAKKVKAMWHMLTMGSSKDFTLHFQNIKTSQNTASCDWEATYTFSLTNRKVINRIHAQFKIENGKIIVHQDSFNFYTWARQAFGLKGLLLGWMPNFQSAVQKKSAEKLNSFIEKNPEYK